jgi:hypothetical protein
MRISSGRRRGRRGEPGDSANAVKIKLADALLNTAGLAHDEARRLTESRTRYFGAAEEINRAQGHELLLNAYSYAPSCVLHVGRTLPSPRWALRVVTSVLLPAARGSPIGTWR